MTKQERIDALRSNDVSKIRNAETDYIICMTREIVAERNSNKDNIDDGIVKDLERYANNH